MHPLAVEQQFVMRVGRFQNWGIGLLACASLFWVYAAWQVFVPYKSTYGAVDCPAPVNAETRDIYFKDLNESAHDAALECASDRNWPGPLAALVISLPLSVIGASLLTAGTVGLRLRRHEDELRRAQN